VGPLLQIALYSVVFGFVFKSRPMAGASELPYVVYLCSALIPWTIYSATLTRITHTFLEHAPYLKKLSIPRWVFVGYVSLSQLVPFAVLFSLFLGLCFVFSVSVSVTGLALYVATFLLGQLLVVGFGLVLATLMVFVRDLGHLLPLGLQLLFWAMPVCYPEHLVPQAAKPLLWLNPFAPLTLALHASVFGSAGEVFRALGSTVVYCGVAWALGAFAYKRLGRWLVDEL
jgi:ABC-type polysaccharide/polyol phosphate export permease